VDGAIGKPCSGGTVQSGSRLHTKPPPHGGPGGCTSSQHRPDPEGRTARRPRRRGRPSRE